VGAAECHGSAYFCRNSIAPAVWPCLLRPRRLGQPLTAPNPGPPRTNRTEPFVWALALPVLGVFLLADLVWGGLLLRRRERKRGLWRFIVGGLWLIAIVVDFAHH